MQPAKSTDSLKVLCISPLEDDHVSLGGIIAHSKWALLKADGLTAALSILRQHDISVVVCEHDLAPGNWIDVLKGFSNLSNPPSLIVTSRLADEHLWAEALNLGAWDVLAKPFDRNEVVRSVKSAWQHWHNQIQMPALTLKVAG